MIGPARVAAYEILRAVSSERADLPAAVAAARARLADPRDAALAADIAVGVQRWRNALDHVVAAAAGRPLAKLDPEVVDILRLSAYQLLHLTRVPAAAVVDDAVNLARRARKGSAAGLVNAVLRRLSRERRNLPLPPRPPDARDRDAAVRYLSVTLSHPAWLVERWLDRLGFERTEAWLRFDNAPAPLTLRPNPFRTTRAALLAALEGAGVAARPGRFAPDALIVDDWTHLHEVASELYSIQDEASQLVTLAAGPRPGLRVLDTCASPGGKAMALAAAMGGQGLLVAADVRERRIALLRRTLAASGAPNVRILQTDLRRPLPVPAVFDTVLVDAPCSGLGALRRDPDIRWRRHADDLARLAAAQALMIRHAADAVAPGGRLVYATCSSEPEENDAIVDGLLAERPAFRAVDLRRDAWLPGAVVDDRGRLRTEPDRHDLEAFFAAALERVRRAEL
jgi:16S rRNA (cytosine967-C5)-methyltransferase